MTHSIRALSAFRSSPISLSRYNKFTNFIQKHSFALTGLPFLIALVGASYALAELTQVRYDYHDKKSKSVNKKQQHTPFFFYLVFYLFVNGRYGFFLRGVDY